MKKTFLSLFISGLAMNVYSQTNIFPASGNVGIGTTTPGAKLEVWGTLQARKASLAAMDNSGALELREVDYVTTNQSSDYYAPRIFFHWGNVVNKSIILGYNGNFKFNNSNSLTEFAAIEAGDIFSHGNLGVGGNVVPNGFKLAVNGNLKANRATLMATVAGSDYYHGALEIREVGGVLNTQTSDNYSPRILFHWGGVHGKSIALGNNGNFKLNELNNLDLYAGLEAGNIFSHGKVGIGTTTVPAAYKLAVDGNVVAEKIVVKNSTNWPDYVFKRGYRLPSLADVERFINQHSHLPEIPSAKEVEAKGQDLGEMNRLLLKKVEELTLYVIEQQKQLSTLKEQNKEIENRLKKSNL